MISIIIVNWNTKEFLRSCLCSLEKYPSQHGQEIIVVDNASSDDSVEMVQSEFPKVHLFESTRNLGYAEGNNLAIKHAQGDYLLLLNPDTEISEGALDTGIEILKNNPKISAIGAKLTHPDGRVQNSIRSFPAPFPVLWDVTGFSKLFPNSKTFGAYRMTWFDYDKPAEVEQPMGTFLMIPKSAIEKVGLMDTQFPIFFNEVDWLYRASQLGLKAFYTPVIEILHHGGESTRQVKKAMVWESSKSLLRYYRKHYGLLLTCLLSPSVYTYALIRAKGWNPGFQR